MAERLQAREVLADKRRLWELPDEDLRICFTEREFNAVDDLVQALEEAAKTQAVKVIVLEVENCRLREALWPFSEFARDLDNRFNMLGGPEDAEPDDTDQTEVLTAANGTGAHFTLRRGQFRAARTALQGGQSDGS